MSARLKIVLTGATVVVLVLILARPWAQGLAVAGQAGPSPTASSAPASCPLPSDATGGRSIPSDAAAPDPSSGASPEPPWYPAEFAAWNASIAWRWLDSTICGEAETCWGMDVLSRDGCPQFLSVELTTADEAGAAIGIASHKVAAVKAGDRVRMVFDNVDDAHTAELIAITCS